MLFLPALLTTLMSSTAVHPLTPTYLRTENLVQPLTVTSPKPRFSWEFPEAKAGGFQSHFRILVATSPAKLTEEKADMWDSGTQEGNQTFGIEYSGKPLMPTRRYYWSVRCVDTKDHPGAWSKPASFATGPSEADWASSEWVGAPEEQVKPAKVFRIRGIARLPKPVASAMLYATGLGWFDLFINGKQVNSSFFDPGWTDYSKRVYYRGYDVKPMLQTGDNVVGATLADGWYSGVIGWDHTRDHYGKLPRVRTLLHVTYADGTSEFFGSGGSYQVAPDGRYADILEGETYDATHVAPAWEGKDGWTPAATGAELSPAIEPHPGPPVVAVHEFPTQKVTEPQPGVYVFDLGQNFAGVIRLAIQGTRGQQLTIKYAERLNPDGTAYTTNLRRAGVVDHYTCAGTGPETWTPSFTFHGFQYVEVTGLTQKPDKAMVTGIALSSDAPTAGEFESSDPMLNRLHSNIYWTQRANFIDIPTDCPQRDERLGWTGDAQVYCKAATLNADVQPFFTKWLVDLDDAQRADGQFPMVAPLKVAGDDGGPAWADAGVICPWTIYASYGDTRLLARHYPQMKKFVDFCVARSKPDLSPPEKFHCFGDWLNINDDTPHELIYSAYMAHATEIVAKAASVLGDAEGQAKYGNLAVAMKQEFSKLYVKQDGTVGNGSQSGYVMALSFDLLPADVVPVAGQRLVDNIQAHNWHLTTGFVGTKDLMLVLSQIGRDDVALRLIHNTTFPSWGFTIAHGATSIWERWDGWTPEKGFQDPGMNSFAHYSFGAVYQWMAEHLGGIQNWARAYQEIVIQPVFDPSLTHLSVSYHSVRGMIRSSWRRHGSKVVGTVVVPSNCSAKIVLRDESGKQKEIEAGPGETSYDFEPGK